MIELKTEITKKPIKLSDELCSSFNYKIMFFSTPTFNFLTNYYIIDFQNKELVEIKTDVNNNAHIIQQINPNILNGIPHSVNTLNDKGFYSFSHNNSSGICFKYIDYKENMKILFGDDLKHPDSINWGNPSSTFQCPSNTPYILIGFNRTDDNSVDIVKVYEGLNTEKICNIPQLIDPPHEIIEYNDFILSTTFKLFKAYNKKTKKIYRWPQEVIDDGYDFKNPSDDIEIAPGEIFAYNLKTHECHYLTVGAPPTSHFIRGKDNVFYATAHNLTFHKDKFYFFGPAQLTKWEIKNNSIKKLGIFSHEKAYRCTTFIRFEFEEKEYFVTLAYPNRLVFIDVDTMEILHHHDLSIDLLSNTEDVKSFVNDIHRNNHPEDKYCLNDINRSSDGRYIIFFEKDKVRFYDFKERKVIDEIIEFPTDAAANIETLRPVAHTGIIK